MNHEWKEAENSDLITAHSALYTSIHDNLQNAFVLFFCDQLFFIFKREGHETIQEQQYNK